MDSPNLRNVALVAHVDHGKTTLVDRLLTTCGIDTGQERAMDHIDQERERGITIRAKSAAANWQGTRINFVDTPGHADFGGEVERIMGLVDGVLLLVDAAEGPMPQTRFVLRKALEAGCRPVVVINKVDRPDRRVDAVIDEVFDLMVSLGADDDQLDFTPVFCSAKENWAAREPDGERAGMELILERILEDVPAPAIEEGPFTFQVANLRHDDFVGRVVLGRVHAGTVTSGASIFHVTPDGQRQRGRITKLCRYEGLGPVDIDGAGPGDVVEIAGFAKAGIGDTLTLEENRDPLTAIAVEEPTLSIVFRVNDSPFAGQDGKPLTGRELRARLEKELLDNVALKFEETDRADAFKVSGRGLLHLGVLIETMRREGLEFMAGPPRVLLHDGQEPWEELVVEGPEEGLGKVVELVGARRGQIEGLVSEGGLTRLTAAMPSRGLIGLRTKVLNLTRGEATLVHVFREWGPWAGDIPTRRSGSIISMDTGQINAYALDALNDRGTFFVAPGDPVYVGMVIGEANKDLDVDVNPCKGKKLTNMRTSSSDRSLKFAPPRNMSLEDCLEFSAGDEWVEVTPENVRIRKDLLDAGERKRSRRV